MKAFLNSLFARHYGRSLNQKIDSLIQSFSTTEKSVFWTAVIVLCIVSAAIIVRLNGYLLTPVPAQGGSFIEGIVGVPHAVNPVLASFDVDRDVTSLVYAGLMKADSLGNLVPELAESYTISPDGKVYTFRLKAGLTFHDGSPLTTRDVESTIKKVLDPALKSPRRAHWEGVEVERVDDREIRFTLKQPYAPFLESTTLGILPHAVWGNLSVEQFTSSLANSEPKVGSGPYRISSVEKDADGIPVSYTLKPFEEYALGTPYISKIELKFFGDESAALDAYEKEEIDSFITPSPDNTKDFNLDRSMVIESTLPRTFAVFLNQSQAPIFLEHEVRQALEMTISKDVIVSEVLNGYGVPVDSPLPYPFFNTEATHHSTSTPEERLKKAQALLEKAGWKKNVDGYYEKKAKKETVPLAFSLSTTNASDLVKTALILKDQWKKLGAKVDIKVFEQGDLNQNVLQPRKYQAFLFGEVVGRNLDLYSFWHSSERNHPGLNMALYANSKADTLLENARSASSTKAQKDLLIKFDDEIQKDIPAFFLYAPDIIYLYPKKIQNVTFKNITEQNERFGDIEKWYIETENIWK